MIRSHNHAQMGGYKLPEALSGSAQAFQCISQYLLKAFRIAVRRSAYIHKLKAEVARGCIAVLPDFARNRWPRSREESLQPDEPFSKSDGRPPWSCMRPPNEKQIRCRPQARATSINDSIAWPRGRPPSEELGPAPACRLHLRVRHQPHAWSPILTEARRTDARVPAWSSRGRGSPHATTFGRGPPAPSDCPRRGRRLRPPHRSGILPTSGIRPEPRATHGAPEPVRRTRRRVPDQVQPRWRPPGEAAGPSRHITPPSCLARVVPNDLQISCRRSTHRPH